MCLTVLLSCIYYTTLHYTTIHSNCRGQGRVSGPQEVTESCELLGWYWDLNPGLPKEWPMLLTTVSCRVNSFLVEKQY